MAARQRAQRQYLRRGGALVMTIARRKIPVRKTGGASPPGKPPRSRTKRYKRSILFAPGEENTVIGPVARKKDPSPRLLEAGGRGRITVDIRIPGETMAYRSVVTLRNGTVIRAQDYGYRAWPIRRSIKRRQTTVANYPARPHMGPALQDAQPQLAEIWRDSIRR
jgi:hypothetical protein